MSGQSALSATVHGRVQGVYFRAFVQQRARALGLTGWVRNLPGGRSVEVRAEGNQDKLRDLLDALHQGPRGAHVDRVDTQWGDFTGEFSDFELRFG